jgi:dipeptidyl aminopeptidase/acylaminoacyl peptidase
MQPNQLGDYAIPSDPQLHPDGTRVVFTVTQMDLEEDSYVRRLHIWDGAEVRALTQGPGDSSPRISPDGTTVAFIRKVKDAQAQLALLRLDGGEAEIVTEMPHGAGQPSWSADGSRIAFVADVAHPDEEGVEEEELARRPRRITRFPYRWDNIGWVRDGHLHVYDVAGGSILQVTEGQSSVHSYAWHPDGGEIAFTSARHETAGLDDGTQVFTVSPDGGAATARTDVGMWGAASYDTAGRLHAAYAGAIGSYPGVSALVRIEEDGGHTPLAPDLDRSIEFFSAHMAPGVPQWLDDGSAVVGVEDEGSIRFIRIAADGERTRIIDGKRIVTGVAPRSDGSALAFVASDTTNPGELYWSEGGDERRLSDFNGDFAGAAGLVEPTSFTIEHEGVSIEGWIYLPPGDGKVPVLLNIHGGPASQYGWGFFDEFQVYAGAGYGVVAINPRGSSGYGLDHVRAVVDAWQEEEGPDFRDLGAAVAAAAAVEPRLDTDRVGIMGGSYGGLSTIKLLALDQTYKSAVAERGLYSFTSFAGTSDIGPWFADLYLADPDHDKLWEASPLRGVDRITTPTLVLHSEGDNRTPIEQGEQLFIALYKQGVTTEMVRFPATESHELSRSGSPKHRKERFEIILEWHGRFLG